MVAGSDRIKEFDTLLNTYNGVEGKRHGYYKFNTIDIVSAGERDPDSEGVEGMSASKMRAAASNGDLDSFLQEFPLDLLTVRNCIVMFVSIWVFVKIVIWEICQILKHCVMHILQDKFGM